MIGFKEKCKTTRGTAEYWKERYELSQQQLQASQKECAALKVQVNELREELQFIKNEEDSYDTEQDTLGRIFLAAENALNNTKEQSLTEHDNEVIEKCEQEIDKLRANKYSNEESRKVYIQAKRDFKKAIRNLKTEG